MPPFLPYALPNAFSRPKHTLTPRSAPSSSCPDNQSSTTTDVPESRCTTDRTILLSIICAVVLLTGITLTALYVRHRRRRGMKRAAAAAAAAEVKLKEIEVEDRDVDLERGVGVGEAKKVEEEGEGGKKSGKTGFLEVRVPLPVRVKERTRGET